MILEITGKDNKTLKLIKALKRKNNRTEQGKFVAEGRKLVLEAFEYVPDDIYCIVVTREFLEKEEQIVTVADSVCNKVFVVSQQMFDDISDTDTPQGILAVINMTDRDFSLSESTRDIVVLDGVSEPGNMGTVIRTAEALGFDGIYLMKGCADIYSSKTVRATMGSLFRMKFKTGCGIADIEDLQKSGFTVISTTPGGDTILEEMSLKGKTAVVIGNEAHGVCDEMLKISDLRVKITMEGLAESLNAAIAAGIAMHWIKTCRPE